MTQVRDMVTVKGDPEKVKKLMRKPKPQPRQKAITVEKVYPPVLQRAKELLAPNTRLYVQSYNVVYLINDSKLRPKGIKKEVII